MASSKMSSVLNQGLSTFGLNMGIISRVVGEQYVVMLCESTGHALAKGTEFELQNTYCKDVVESKDTKFYKDVAEVSEMLKHPCYLNTQLRAYIGTPLIVNGKIWGTLNYSSLYPNKSTYTKEEIEFIESQAKTVSTLLAENEFTQST